jgi:uronate dehydrogenase
VHALLQGIDAVVHLGGISTEQPFDAILQANIVGAYNLYEAARQHGVKRIVFASSNHVTGFYRQDEVIDATMPVRPDGYYGLSKAFGENLSRFYFDRYGIETVCLRIGSSFPEPRDRRMLATWLSYDDLERLVVASLTAPVVGHSIVFGMSDNTTTWWDNTAARHVGFRPQDSSEPFRAALEAAQPTLDRQDPAVIYQGGAFVRMGPFE